MSEREEWHFACHGCNASVPTRHGVYCPYCKHDYGPCCAKHDHMPDGTAIIDFPWTAKEQPNGAATKG